MRANKALLMISLILISLLAVSAVSAADSDMDVANPEIDEVSVDDVQAIDNDLKTKEVLSDDAPQEESVVSVATKDTPYNENATIDVSVAKTAITNNSSLKLFIDGEEKGNLTLDEEGKASYTIPAKTFDAGKYFIQAVLDDGSSKVAGMSTLNITKVTPVISVPDVTEKSGNVITIPFNVTDNKGEIVGGEVFISIYWENDYISKYIDLGNGSTSEFDIASIIGIFSRNSTGNGTGNGTGIADLLNRNSTGNGTGNGTGIADLFNRNSTNSSGNGTGNGTGIADLLNRNSTNSTGNGTGNGTGTGDMDLAKILELIMGGGDTTGTFAYVFEKGEYNVTVKYMENRNYNAAINDTAKLTITPLEDVLINTTITSAKSLLDNTTIAIILTDGYEKPIAGGQMNVTLDGEDKGKVTANEEGMADLAFEGLAKGDHNITLTYKNTTKTFDFFVSAETIETIIEYQDMNTTSVNAKVDGRIGEYFYVTLKDKDGKLLADKPVQIGFNGKIYNKTTDENGTAKLQINLISAGFYTFAVCYLGDEAYNASFVVAKINVKKATAKLTSKDASYKASAKTKTIKATLKSAKGNAIADKKISFTVNGKTYTAKTDSKGVATVKVSISKKGTYSFTAKFAGDNGYTQISTKGKLTIK